MQETEVMKYRSALLSIMLAAAAAPAGPLPPVAFLSIGYREATMADFIETPEATVRKDDPHAFLSVTADFNGDGKPDEARILLNEQRQIAYVVAVIQTDKVDTFVLAQMPLSESPKIGITAAAPMNTKGSAHRPGVTIFGLDTGNGEANYFDGEEFSKRVPISRRIPNSI